MPLRPRAFISYSRQDGEAFAAGLRKRLERESPDVTIWQDRAQLEGGVGWWRQITEALDQVRYLILVLTPAALRSPIVGKEWQYARQRGVCVYPVMGTPPECLDIGSLPRWMRKAHFFNLEYEWKSFLEYLRGPCKAPRVPFMAPDYPENFVRRPEEYGQLLRHLLGDHGGEPREGAVALYGGGGFGKTTLAVALCHDEAILTAFDDGILWATLGESPDILAALTSLCGAISGGHPTFRNAAEAAGELVSRLDENDYLLVIDDVWDRAHLAPFLRGGKGCAA